ncbi:serine hydrolase [Ilyomonas limi]|uniref:beta-lactamase n=1 Tax=Ilyomonas limi TaxID=2575867 RepID=A0A4U3L5F7_9BACT|nr:serine hydrolase [Ilyomonas limi]TKK70172.1 serine hydrolase [Ilyomonas limi]
MKNHYFLCLLLLCATTAIHAQKTDKKLRANIQSLLQGFNGDVGVYVHDLEKGKTVAINADSIFPTASMIKIPILIGTMHKIEDSELQYHQELIYSDSLLYPGVDILGSFKDTEHIELSKIMMLMLTMSDNTASLWLQSLAGGGQRINAYLDSLGMKVTRVNSRTPGRKDNQSKYGWGQTSPREMATLMEMIVKGQIISKAASDRMLRLLSRNYWDEEAVSQVPAGVFVASKNGAVDESRSEVMYVNGKHCRYIFCICTNNNKDTSWAANNEAWVLTRKLSKLLWEYYGSR